MKQRVSAQQIIAFHKKIFQFYRLHGRHNLPFRKTKNPYHIAVSEIMLQQTQVPRVIPKYRAWIHTFPSWLALSRASQQNVLARWSGLGYNRRALYLRAAAQEIVSHYKGKTPESIETIASLPGFGPYSSRAVLIFAFNKNLVTIDTNIRRVLIHELNLSPRTPLKEIWEIAALALPKGKSRDWHNALMDYATLALPKTPDIKPLSKQTRFKGSLREIRGEIIRSLLSKKYTTVKTISKKMKRAKKDVFRAAQGLKKEHIVHLSGVRISLQKHD